MKKGFTLLELLIVVVIIGVLALIAAPSLLNASDTAKEGAVKGNVSAAASSITSRYAINSSETAANVALNVTTDLNTDAKNPFNTTASAFSTTAKTEGTVNIANTSESPRTIVLTGYGKSAKAIITKTIKAPQ